MLETKALPAAVIHLTVPRERIQEVMGPAIAEVMEAVRAQGIGPAGALFAHHFGMRPGVFNFEVGVPVSADLVPVGRVFLSELPAAKVIRTIYRGPYEGLGEAWDEFMKEIEAAGHQPAGNLWETYLSGPESGPDPAGWTTELNCVISIRP
jgi:effector-binding domain-containing protein